MTNTRINELRKKIDYNTVELAWEDPYDNSNLNTVEAERYDLQDEIFDSGFGLENYLSMTGGNEKTSYYLSASHLSNEGIVKNTSFKRYGFKGPKSKRATASAGLVLATNTDVAGYTPDSSGDGSMELSLKTNPVMAPYALFIPPFGMSSLILLI